MSPNDTRVLGGWEKPSEAITANCEESKGSPVLRKLRKDIGGQVKGDSSKNLR